MEIMGSFGGVWMGCWFDVVSESERGENILMAVVVKGDPSILFFLSFSDRRIRRS